MGSLLEEMHKMRLKEKIEELESIGGNPCRRSWAESLSFVRSADIFLMKQKEDHFTTLSRVNLCHVGQQQFER